MLVPKHKVTSFLDNKTYSLIEIKYTINSYQSTSSTNYWLLYDKNNDMLIPLDLVSSSSEKGKYIRKFEDSELSFDNKNGFYNDGKSTHEFKTLDPTVPIYKKLKEAIDDYILLINLKVKP